MSLFFGSFLNREGKDKDGSTEPSTARLRFYSSQKVAGEEDKELYLPLLRLLESGAQQTHIQPLLFTVRRGVHRASHIITTQYLPRERERRKNNSGTGPWAHAEYSSRNRAKRAEHTFVPRQVFGNMPIDRTYTHLSRYFYQGR